MEIFEIVLERMNHVANQHDIQPGIRKKRIEMMTRFATLCSIKAFSNDQKIFIRHHGDSIIRNIVF